MEPAKRLTHLLRRLPDFQYACAYGSGVVHQPGLYENAEIATASSTKASSPRQQEPTTPRPMVDYILAVEDPHAWHEENVKRNTEHYSWVAKLGPQAICGIAEHVGVGVHFNTMVPIDGQMVKYGVVSTSKLVEDLTTWRFMYLAGRMQKPVAHLQHQQQVDAAQRANLRSAATTALVLLPQSFTTQELFHQIVGLSYHGDIRMGIAEDPHKIQRIIQGSWQGLEGLYLGMMSGPDSPGVVAGVKQVGEQRWQQDVSTDTRLQLLELLPSGLLHQMAYKLGYQVPESHLNMESTRKEVLWAALKSNQYQQVTGASLKAIVRKSSGYQAVAGALSAGGGKAVEYVLKKIQKAINSRKPSTAGRSSSS